LEAEQKRLDRDAMEREMTGMLRTAYGSVRRAAVQLAFIHATETPLLLQSLQLSQREYMDGKRSFSTVLENYSMLVMSSMNAAMQRMEYAMAVTMIEELTGASL
jgi:outer membrane protein TolC